MTTSDDGSGDDTVIAQGSKSLGSQQTAFDAEVTAIESALYWFTTHRHGYRGLVIHSDSTSAIARAGHTGAGPGQEHAIRIQRWVFSMLKRSTPRTVAIRWVKGHAGTPGNEKADHLAGEAAERPGPYTAMSLAHLKLEDLRKVQGCQREMARRPGTPWHDGDPPAGTQKIHARSGKELHSSSGGTDPYRPLALGGIHEEDPQAGVP